MPRLIDADALIEECNNVIEEVDAGEVNEDYYDGYEDGVENIRDYAEHMPTVDADPHWILCSERMPEMKEIVLITNDKGHVRCGQYRGVGFFSKNDGRPHWNWKGNTLETVVAWMPLPEPYEGDKE